MHTNESIESNNSAKHSYFKGGNFQQNVVNTNMMGINLNQQFNNHNLPFFGEDE
jgi:hypothetical protein